MAHSANIIKKVNIGGTVYEIHDEHAIHELADLGLTGYLHKRGGYMSKKTPAIIKRDTRENWEKSKYIPEENVIILMDNEDGTTSLMIGDGETNVNKLPDLIKDKTFKRAIVDEQSTLIL